SVEEHPVKVAIPKPAGMTGGTNKGSAAQGTKKKVGNAPAQESKGSGANLFMLMGAFVTIVLIGVLIFVMVIL
ncbi:hypothetical protein CH372_19660, partial [Leptospira meyeri]